MANRFANLVGSKKISEDFNNINIGFDRVQSEMDTGDAIAANHIANANIHVTAAKKAEWDGKAPGSTATDLTTHKADQVAHMTKAQHDKLDGIEDNAQVNQNAFSRVNDIAAVDPSSHFYIVGGLGITVTTNPLSGEVTVTATGEAAPGAHGETHTEHGADPIPNATITEGGLLSAARLAEIVAHGELLEEHATAITVLEEGVNDLAGAGRTTETVKGNAEDIIAVNAQLADIANSGFVGTFKPIPVFTDFNNLTTPGTYHGVLNVAYLHEPIYPSAGARRVTIIVEADPSGFFKQRIIYNAGVNANSEYFRVFDAPNWSDWSQVLITGSNPASITDNGYQKLASGLILQWGTLVNAASAVATHPLFPLTYPNKCLHASAVVDISGVSFGPVANVFSITNSQLGIAHNATGNKNIMWFSIGY
ncbi:pyocin knob domain-containing protein [Paenibacillus sp. FSL K6-2524]|uniref:pyocin knob domain-containing protein n=1 Tax=Paenibacillus sp. FSL K6-2524 TaxID=2954516 RepID=UPI0030F90226